MGDDRPAVRRDILVNRLENGVVRQQVLARFRFYFHADGLVDFYGDRSRREVLVELADCLFAETGLLEVIRAECRAENGAARSAVSDPLYIAALGVQSLEVRITVVKHADVEDMQFQTLQQSAKSRVILVRVHVRVNRIHLCKRVEQPTRGTCAWPRTLLCQRKGT